MFCGSKEKCCVQVEVQAPERWTFWSMECYFKLGIEAKPSHSVLSFGVDPT